MIPPSKAIIADPDDTERDDKQMTDKQAAELRELCARLDEPFDAMLTQTQADARIAALRDRT